MVNSAVVGREVGGQGGGGVGYETGRIDERLRGVRGRMEKWLEVEGERRDLRGCIRRAERLVAEKTRGRK